MPSKEFVNRRGSIWECTGFEEKTLPALLALGYALENIVVHGESAGATLALYIPLMCRDAGILAPKAVVALSPKGDCAGRTGWHIRSWTCMPRASVPVWTKDTLFSEEYMLFSGEDKPLPYKLPARSISS